MRFVICTIRAMSLIYPTMYFELKKFYLFSTLRDLEKHFDEMRRPLFDEIVRLWTTMGLGYENEDSDVQSKRILPMVNFFMGIYFSSNSSILPSKF